MVQKGKIPKVAVALLFCALLLVPFQLTSFAQQKPDPSPTEVPSELTPEPTIFVPAEPGQPGYIDLARLPFVEQESLPFCDERYDMITDGEADYSDALNHLYDAPTCRPKSEEVLITPDNIDQVYGLERPEGKEAGAAAINAPDAIYTDLALYSYSCTNSVCRYNNGGTHNINSMTFVVSSERPYLPGGASWANYGYSHRGVMGSSSVNNACGLGRVTNFAGLYHGMHAGGYQSSGFMRIISEKFGDTSGQCVQYPTTINVSYYTPLLFNLYTVNNGYQYVARVWLNGSWTQLHTMSLLSGIEPEYMSIGFEGRSNISSASLSNITSYMNWVHKFNFYYDSTFKSANKSVLSGANDFLSSYVGGNYTEYDAPVDDFTSIAVEH